MCDATEIIVEMNQFLSNRNAFYVSMYIHRIIMVSPLSDGFIIVTWFCYVDSHCIECSHCGYTHVKGDPLCDATAFNGF